ncbi:MAG: ribonuclease P protein component [Chloroflexota bacterium]
MRRRHRLRTDAQFKRVRSGGRSWAHPLLVLYALPNQEGVTRVGFSVGKRIGKAVARNHVKRRLREAIRPRLPMLKVGYDLVLIARAPIASAAYPEVVAAVEQLLQRARLVLLAEGWEEDRGPTERQLEGGRARSRKQ